MVRSSGRHLPSIIAKRVRTAIDAVPDKESVEEKPLHIRFARSLVTGLFTGWANSSKSVTTLLGWFPKVEPYIGYGTQEFSRLICRTTYAPHDVRRGRLVRGIRAALMVPATGVPVKITIDGIPLKIVQVGRDEVYDPVDSGRDQSGDFVASDVHGYLDLLAMQRLAPGIHNVSYRVAHRRPVFAPLHIVPDSARIGIISDVDDTIIVTQIPSPLRATVNMMFRSPRSRHAVHGMSRFYNGLHAILPDTPFFYLSTSPWNVEAGFRHILRAKGFPQGPLLLRDLDPRAGTFIPSGVEHKLEFAKQLMSDFPDMKFILIGDDGQKDPTTFAEIVSRFPGRVLAIGIRQLSSTESFIRNGIPIVNPVPQTDVPVFYGHTGEELGRTMLPFIRQCAQA
jgi:phosphatidate phosphatase APP1